MVGDALRRTGAVRRHRRVSDGGLRAQSRAQVSFGVLRALPQIPPIGTVFRTGSAHAAAADPPLDTIGYQSAQRVRRLSLRAFFLTAMVRLSGREAADAACPA